MKKIALILVVVALVFGTTVSQAQIRMTLVDPANGMVWVKNYGSTNVDLSNYRFCHNFSYPAMSSLTLSAGTTIGAGATKLITGLSLANVATGSDVGLYLPDAGGGVSEFANAAMMLDFMQYGSGGNGRESVAVAKGIWSAGDFALGTPAYTYIGNGTTDNGVAFWNGNPTAVNQVVLNQKATLFPNPANTAITVNLDNNVQITLYEIIDVTGRMVLDQGLNLPAGTSFTIDVSNLPNGNYTLMMDSSEGAIQKQIVIFH